MNDPVDGEGSHVPVTVIFNSDGGLFFQDYDWDRGGVVPSDAKLASALEHLPPIDPPPPRGSQALSFNVERTLWEELSHAAATRGIEVEALIARAVAAKIEERTTSRSGRCLSRVLSRLVLLGVIALPAVLLFVSPPIHGDRPNGQAWYFFIWSLLMAALILLFVLVSLFGRGGIEAMIRASLWQVTGYSATALVEVITIFAYLYWFLSNATHNFFNEPISRFGAVYLVISVLGTLGTGSVTPMSAAAQAILSIQIGVNAILIIVGVGILVARGMSAFQRETGEPVTVRIGRRS